LNVLIVLGQPPLPEGKAPARCAVGLLRGLSLHGIEITAIAARRPWAVTGKPPSDLPVATVPAPSPALSRMKDVLGLHGRLRGGEFLQRVRQLAADTDVIHIEEATTAWPCGRHPTRPSAVHLHFLATLDQSLPWRSGRALRDFLLYVAAERAAVRRHRFLVASSPVIASVLRRASPRTEVVLAPLSLDPAYYPAACLDGVPRAGIIGTAAWPPTASALERLTTRVWPQVRREMPDAQLIVAGRGMRSVDGLERMAGVELRGEVASAAEFLRDLSVLLYPVERGSGMKLKVLEAIASGVPVVTTPAGAEGIEANEGVIVETTDRRLADAAIELLRDPLARRERGAAARAAFHRRYTPKPATEPLVDLYRRMSQN
jgi:glycosyltransferase involved in cell wall biosynthesis